MSLIICPKCGKETDDTTGMCNHCECQLSSEVDENEGYEKPENVKNEVLTTDNYEIMQTEDYKEIEGKKRRKKKKIIISSGIFITLAVLCVIVFFATTDLRKYYSAQKALEAGNYTEAAQSFKELGDYKDSTTMVNESEYQYADKLYKEKKYENAIKIYVKLKNYKESVSNIQKCEYEIAEDLLKSKKYKEASEKFEKLGKYKDADDKYKECRYQEAGVLLKEGSYEKALPIYKSLSKYKDSSDKYKECRYLKAESYYLSEMYDEAAIIYEELGDYKDSEEKLEECLPDEDMTVDEYISNMKYFLNKDYTMINIMDSDSAPAYLFKNSKTGKQMTFSVITRINKETGYLHNAGIICLTKNTEDSVEEYVNIVVALTIACDPSMGVDKAKKIIQEAMENGTSYYNDITFKFDETTFTYVVWMGEVDA